MNIKKVFIIKCPGRNDSIVVTPDLPAGTVYDFKISLESGQCGKAFCDKHFPGVKQRVKDWGNGWD